MKVYLDDIRPAPAGWWLAQSVKQAIRLISRGDVTVISLDHDLGENRKTGDKVLTWLYTQVARYGFAPPEILIHTMNPVGRQKMETVKKLIENFRKEK